MSENWGKDLWKIKYWDVRIHEKDSYRIKKEQNIRLNRKIKRVHDHLIKS